MINSNKDFYLCWDELSVEKVCMVFLYTLFSITLIATSNCADAAESRHSKKSKHKSHKAKIAVSNSQIIRPKVYPRTNFMPYGYFAAARSQGVDLQAWNRPAPKKSGGTILQSMTKSLGATDQNSDAELSKLIDSRACPESS